MKESICSQRGSVNSFLLSALKNGDKYAYEIGKAVKEISGGQFVLKEASLYSGLKRLEAQGYLSSYSTTLENGLTRRYYSLTQSGRQKLENIDFSWDNDQKASITKVFSEKQNTSANSNIINATEKNIKHTDDLITKKPEINHEAIVHSVVTKITVSDEEDNLTEHIIHENQQNLFSVLENKASLTENKTNQNLEDNNYTKANYDNSANDASLLNNETENNSTYQEETSDKIINNIANDNKNVDEIEFYNLKNNYKTDSSSFLDKINSHEAKVFYNNSENLVNFNKNEEKVISVNEVIDFEENNSENKKNTEENDITIQEAPIKSVEDGLSKIDINDIFGDLCISSSGKNMSEIDNINISDNKNEKINIPPSAKLVNEDKLFSKSNITNINCSLEIPEKKEIAEDESSNQNLPFSTKSVDDILAQKDKNLNDLFEIKNTPKRPSITVNNSVLYANNKIDYDKPSFETNFDSNKTPVYEIRPHKPIEQKHIKTTFISINKVKMCASIIAFIVELLLIAGIYLLLDKTPFNKFNALQIVMYSLAFSIFALELIIKIMLFIKNKFKIVKNLDYKTNLLFKLLFGMCLISTLFIAYKFFDINIANNFSYLLLVPSSVILNFVLEEVFKFYLSKMIKN